MQWAGSRVGLATGGGWMMWEGVHAVRWLQEVAGEYGQDAMRGIAGLAIGGG